MTSTRRVASLLLLAAVSSLAAAAARAEAAATLPLAAHRAAYDLSLAEPSQRRPPSGQTPVSARGLIAYEFTGSACEGYASTFRQLTELQRAEGDPISSKINAVTYEDGAGTSMRFRIDTEGGSNSPPVAGKASRATSGETSIELTAPSARKLDIGADALFPTQHVEKLISAARAGESVVSARVYDGSDTGAKVYTTLTVIGREATTPSDDATTAEALAKVRRWPVVVSYFDETTKDTPPEYVLSFDLYENGVSGSLKLDYGSFALSAKLSRFELLPTKPCPN